MEFTTRHVEKEGSDIFAVDGHFMTRYLGLLAVWQNEAKNRINNIRRLRYMKERETLPAHRQLAWVVIFFYPFSHLLLVYHVHQPETFLLRAIPIETRDLSTDTPHVIPGGVEQIPPTIGWRGGKRDTQMAHGKEDRGTDDGGHCIQRIRRRLQSRTRVRIKASKVRNQITHASFK